MTKRVPLPEPVAHIYKATAALEALYPGRKFTPDGHLVGAPMAIAEVTTGFWLMLFAVKTQARSDQQSARPAVIRA